MSLDFWLTALLVTASPGSGSLYTIATAMTRGSRASFLAALGCTVGLVPHLVLAVTGAAAVLAASPTAFEVIRWFGVAYLLHLGVSMWRSRGVFALEADAMAPGAPRPWLGVLGAGALINLLNPLTPVFFFVFLPMFVDPRADDAVLRLVGLGLAFMALTLVVFGLYGAAAGGLRRHVVGRPGVMRWTERGFAVAFLALAVMLAFTRR